MMIKTLTDTELGAMFSEWVKKLEPLTHNERLRLTASLVVFYSLPVHLCGEWLHRAPIYRAPDG